MKNVSEQNLHLKQERKLIRIKKVMELTSLSKSYLYALDADGKFPKSVSIVPGGSSKGWVESEVQAYVDQRIAERDQGVNHG